MNDSKALRTLYNFVMNKCERLWVVFAVVCVCSLTLFTVNGLPFRERDSGYGIDDDPAESDPLSLAKRGEPSGEQHSTSISPGTAYSDKNSFTTVSSNVNATDSGLTTLQPALNASSLNRNVTSGVNNTASRGNQNVSINATTTSTGNTLGITSFQNMSNNHLNSMANTINPSPTDTANMKNTTGVIMATYTLSLRSSFTQTPSVSASKLSVISSAIVDLKQTVGVSSLIQADLPVSISRTIGVVSASNSSGTITGVNASVPFNHSHVPSGAQFYHVNPTGATSIHGLSIPSPAQNPSGALFTQNMSILSTPVVLSTQSVSGLTDVNNPSVMPTTKNVSVMPTTNNVSGVPFNYNHSGIQSTTNNPGAPSNNNPSLVPTINNSADLRFTDNLSAVPATNTPFVGTEATSQTLPNIPSTGEHVTVPSIGLSSTGLPSTMPSTTEIQEKESTPNHPDTEKQVPTEQSRKHTTNGNDNLSTNVISVNALSNTKPATTKAKISTKKTTAARTKAKNQNDGKMT